MSEFRKELEGLINSHSQENESNTPDWILAQYILKSLDAFNQATRQRERWYSSPSQEDTDESDA
jgi:hypothetical protein